MVEQEILTRGGVYLARLDPAKEPEVGKIRPVVILNTQSTLDISPAILFVCPLTSRSKPEYESLRVELPPRDNLKATSYTLIEHCRAIWGKRIIHPRLAQLTTTEISSILNRLRYLVGM